MPAIEEAITECGCTIEALQGEKDLPLAKPPRRVRAFKLALDEGKWYFAENAEDIYPLVLVRRQQLTKVADDQGGEREVQSFLLEMIDPDDGMPYQIEAEAKHVSQLGLRPATLDDFEDRDMVPPTFGTLVNATTATPRTASSQNFGRLRPQQR